MPKAKHDPAFPGFLLFRVAASGWARLPGVSAFGRPVLANARRDVWQVELPDGSSEQLFTYAAAVRELRRAGIALPAAAELADRALDIGGLHDDERFLLGKSLSGFRHARHGAFYDQASCAYRWAENQFPEPWRRRRGYSAVKTGPSGRSVENLPAGALAPVSVAAGSVAERPRPGVVAARKTENVR